MAALSAFAQEWLEERGLDVDLAIRLGAESRFPHGVREGEWYALPFMRDDKPVNWKFRRLDQKDFRSVPRDKGGVTCLWNEGAIFDRGLRDQPLVVTEGLEKAMAFMMAGYQRVVSVPDGAGAAGGKGEEQRESRHSYLDDRVLGAIDKYVSRVIIAGDADAQGYKLTEDLSTLLGASRCKYVPYPPGCNDIVDVLTRFGLDRVKEQTQQARWVNVAGVRRFSDYPPGSDGDPIVWRSEISKAFDRHVGIMPGYISCWTGVPNHGKSTLLNQIGWRLAGAAGRIDDDLLHDRALADEWIASGRRIAVGSFEAQVNRDYKRAALQYLLGRPRDGWVNAGGPWTREEIDLAMAWLEEHVIPIDPHGYAENDSGTELEEFEPTFSWVMEASRTAIVRYNCEFVELDPWGEIVQERERQETEHEYTGRALTSANRMARTLKAHLAFVAHPKKLEITRDRRIRKPGPYDISGSSYWFNKVSLGATVHRDPEIDPETKKALPGSTRTEITVWKSKFHDVQGKPGIFHLNFVPRDNRFEAA